MLTSGVYINIAWSQSVLCWVVMLITGGFVTDLANPAINPLPSASKQTATNTPLETFWPGAAKQIHLMKG